MTQCELTIASAANLLQSWRSAKIHISMQFCGKSYFSILFHSRSLWGRALAFSCCRWEFADDQLWSALLKLSFYLSTKPSIDNRGNAKRIGLLLLAGNLFVRTSECRNCMQPNCTRPFALTTAIKCQIFYTCQLYFRILLHNCTCQWYHWYTVDKTHTQCVTCKNWEPHSFVAFPGADRVRIWTPC